MLLRPLELLLFSLPLLHLSSSYPFPILHYPLLPCPILSHTIPSYPIHPIPEVLPFSFSHIIDDHVTLLHPNLFHPSLISPPSLLPTRPSLFFLTRTPGLSIAPLSYSPSLVPHSSLFSSLPFLTRTPGLSIAPLSASDRKEVMSISHRWFLEDFDVVAFAYTPVHNNVSRQLRYPFFICITDIATVWSWRLLSQLTKYPITQHLQRFRYLDCRSKVTTI